MRLTEEPATIYHAFCPIALHCQDAISQKPMRCPVSVVVGVQLLRAVGVQPLGAKQGMRTKPHRSGLGA